MLPAIVSIWLCLIISLTGQGNTLSAAEPAQGKVDFVVVNEPVQIPERGLVTGYCVIADEHRFSFIPPLDWRLESNRGEKSVTLTPRELDTAIRLRLLPEPAARKAGEEADWAASMLKARYPDARIKDRFACHTSSSSGVAFDLLEDYGGNLRLYSRVAFVPYEKGMLEIRQTRLAGEAAPAYQEFGMLMTSLRVTPKEPGN